MKKKILRVFLGFFGICGLLLAGLWGFFRLRCMQAWKKKDDTHPQMVYDTAEGGIAYRSIGCGRPLLLVHSMMPGASSREWDAVAEALAENYHVYAIDLPGFGNSYCPQKPWTAYQYANCLHDFIANVIGRSACICGANGGADFALILSLLHPEDVSRLVLISPEGIGRGFATEEEVKPLSLLLAPIIGTQKFLSGTSCKSMQQRLEHAYYAPERVYAGLVQQYVDAARCGRYAQATFAGLQTRFYAADTIKAFTQLCVPFLMLWGEENRDNPCEYLEAAEKLKTYGSFVLFEKTAALPHMENSRAFLDHVQEFLK